MLNELAQRTMTRARWSKIRSSVRRHALINAQQALEKRMLLSDSSEKVLMGGIVVKKQDMAGILCDNAQYQTRCVMPVERGQLELGMLGGQGHGERSVLENAGFDFLIYDFSETFKVSGSLGDFDRDLRRKMYRLKEGDVVFVEGALISLNCPSGYIISPTNFYSEEEISFYRQIYPDVYDRRGEALNVFKKRSFQEPDEYTLMTARQPWDVIKLFLKPSHSFDPSHYFWLESAAYDFFEKTEDIRAAQLVLKYYLIEMLDEKKRYEQDEIGAYSVDLKEYFFELYPNLLGIVEWPDAE